jgi:hypothetical protein
MKKIGLFIAFASSLLCSSCSEDFKVGAPYKNVMVVYGLLNPTDTAQYIKITRGFFDEKGNNLISAKVADSIYYKNLSVLMEERSPSGNLIRTITLDKVELHDEGIVKDSGIFVSKPAYAYKVKVSDKLKNNFDYKLIITNPESGAVITASTKLLSNDPNDLRLENFLPGFSSLDFSVPTAKSRFTWLVPATSGISEVFLRFHYLERENNTIDNLKFVDLPIVTGLPVTPGNNLLFSDYPNSSFLGSVKGGVKVPTNNVKRYVDTANIIIYAGGNVLSKYISIANAQGGITADQIKPVFTNLVSSNPSKEDVYGLFDTRTSVLIKRVPFSQRTIDSLVNSPLIQDARFVGVSPI